MIGVVQIDSMELGRLIGNIRRGLGMPNNKAAQALARVSLKTLEDYKEAAEVERRGSDQIKRS